MALNVRWLERLRSSRVWRFYFRVPVKRWHLIPRFATFMVLGLLIGHYAPLWMILVLLAGVGVWCVWGIRDTQRMLKEATRQFGNLEYLTFAVTVCPICDEETPDGEVLHHLRVTHPADRQAAEAILAVCKEVLTDEGYERFRRSHGFDDEG